MDRHTTVTVVLTEEEAYELLMRSMANEQDDNTVFHSALEKLASAIKSSRRKAA